MLGKVRALGVSIVCLMIPGSLPAQSLFDDFLLSRPGIVSYWGMEETTGNSVADSVTDDSVDGDNPGTFALGSGASLNVAGPRPSNGFSGMSNSNNAIHFAGTAGQRLDMNPAGYTGSGGLVSATIASWFRLTAASTEQAHHHLGGLQKEQDGVSLRYGLAMNNYPQTDPAGSGDAPGGLRAFARPANAEGTEAQYNTGSSNLAGNVSFWDSQWHYAVTTFEPYGNRTRVLNLYVDGVLVQRDISPSPTGQLFGPNDPLGSRNALTFGEDAGDNTRLWKGQLDGISTFGRAMTGAEVGAAFLAAKGVTVNHAILPTHGVAAHRGASETHPENTIAGLREAVNMGAHQVEFDVQLTSDGKLVLMHDNTINRTTDGTGRVRDMTLAQLKAFDAGSWKNATFTGEKIPTLEEALEVLPLNMVLNVEVKGVSGNDAATAQAVAAVLHTKGRLHQSMISGSKATATAVQAYESANSIDIKLNNLDREGGNTPAYVAYTINNGYDYIQLRHDNTPATPAEITALQNAGVSIFYFKDDNPNNFATHLDNGYDFVLTDTLAAVMGAAVRDNIVPLLAIYRGDFTMNGSTDTSDFDLFFQALTDPTGFAVENPDFDANIYGDFDVNGVLDVNDYEGFHNAVTTGPTLTGDYNLDGIVDQGDYVVWKAALGLSSLTNLVPADGNSDGVVNLADYTVWRDNLGATAPSELAAFSTNIPEPSAMLSLGCLLAAAGVWCRGAFGDAKARQS